MLLEPAPRARHKPGEIVFIGTFDLSVEEPGDQSFRRRARRQTLRAQVFRGKGGCCRKITPGQTPDAKEFKNFRPVSPGGPARSKPDVQVTYIEPGYRSQLIQHARRQVPHRFQEPASLPVVHKLGRSGQSRPWMLRCEETLFGRTQLR